MGRLTHTVSGSIASIRTPSRVPIESLKFHFLPKQASGTPTPANPIPIEGWTGLNGGGHGINLWDEQWEIGRINVNNGQNDNNIKTTIRSKNYIPCKPGTEYYIRHPMGSNNLCLFYYDKHKNFISYVWKYSGGVTVPNDCYYLRFYLHNSYGTEYNNDIGINYPSTETSYVKYIGNEEIPVTFPVAGTNILDIEQTSKINAGASGSIITIQNGVISIDAVASSARSFVMFSQVFPAGTYTIRAAYSGSVTKPRLLTTIEIANSSYNSYYSAYSKQLASEYMSFTANESFSIGLVLSNSPNESGNPGSLYDIQLEHGDVVHNYEPYSSDNTFYGGYVDPVAGEIVAEYAMLETTWGSGSTGTVLGDTRRRGFYVPSIIFADAIDLHNDGQGPYGKYRRTLCNVVPWGWDYYSDYPHYYINNHDINIMMPVDTSDDTVIQFCAWLKTPIHIPIPAEDMKAFLDHNNFWSDANDITEATYEVTESRNMLATRKKALGFNYAYHKKVKWNQLSIDGNFELTGRNYAWNTTYGEINIANNIGKWTAKQVPPYYYDTGFMYTPIYLAIPYNHKVLVMADIKTSAGVGNFINIYGMVTSSGGAHTYYYGEEVPTNQWTTIKGFIKDRPETPPSGFDDVTIKRFKVLVSKLYNATFEDVCPVGTTLEVKKLMAFDLTQMFGLGNEPQTVEEFEHICEINGIDLTTYQPYDEGSDRWLIIP